MAAAFVFVCVTCPFLLWDSQGSIDSHALWALFLGQSFGRHSPEKLLVSFAIVCLLKHGQGKVSCFKY